MYANTVYLHLAKLQYIITYKTDRFYNQHYSIAVLLLVEAKFDLTK